MVPKDIKKEEESDADDVEKKDETSESSYENEQSMRRTKKLTMSRKREMSLDLGSLLVEVSILSQKDCLNFQESSEEVKD